MSSAGPFEPNLSTCLEHYPQLAQADDTVLNQKQRPTRNPTFRWFLQKFQSIHLVSMGSSQQVTNLSEERSKIIRPMGFPTCRYYLLD